MTQRVRSALLAVVTTAVLASCGPADASLAPGVYVLELPDGEPRFVGQPSGVPIWSPDGGQIAWGSEAGLSVVSKSGGPVRILADRPVAGRPAWSPDGALIAFMDEQSMKLVVIDAASGIVTLTADVASNVDAGASVDVVAIGGPSWSPDGETLAFVCWDGHGDEVCTVDIDGNGRRQLTRLEPLAGAGARPARNATATSNVGPPAWSPAGDSIAVAAYPERSGAPGGVFVIDLNRDAARRVSQLLPNSELSWSEDGKSILFSASERGRSDVVRLDVDSERSEKLTANLPAGARDPAVTPAGELVAVTSGSSIEFVTDEAASPLAVSPGRKNAAPQVNRSGTALAFAVLEDPLTSFD